MGVLDEYFWYLMLGFALVPLIVGKTWGTVLSVLVWAMGIYACWVAATPEAAAAGSLLPLAIVLTLGTFARNAWDRKRTECGILCSK